MVIAAISNKIMESLQKINEKVMITWKILQQKQSA